MFRRIFPLARAHFWTVAPVAHSWVFRPPLIGPCTPWRTALVDDDMGEVVLTGALHRPFDDADTVLIALHGLGGDIESHYIRRAAAAAERHGIDCLRLNMRGADMSGHDYYHAGLTTDLHATLASPELARYRRILLLGYSIGGHLVLRCGLESDDERVRGVVAVCPPLDLALAGRDMDKRRRWPYRHHVLAALRDMLRAMHRRGRRLPIPLEDALRIGTFRRWDESLIAPRFGFAGADDYYRRMSVGPRLGELTVPSLIIGTAHDPMVLRGSIESALGARSHDLVEVRWLEDAGHVGFPPHAALETQAVQWLLSRG